MNLLSGSVGLSLCVFDSHAVRAQVLGLAQACSASVCTCKISPSRKLSVENKSSEAKRAKQFSRDARSADKLNWFGLKGQQQTICGSLGEYFSLSQSLSLPLSLSLSQPSLTRRPMELMLMQLGACSSRLNKARAELIIFGGPKVESFEAPRKHDPNQNVEIFKCQKL